MSYDYDLLAIGAGSGGLAAAKRAASYGAKVAIAERELVGGTCVIRGCVPKKLLVYGSQFSRLYAEAVGYGWSPVESSLNWQYLIAAIDKEVRRLSEIHIGLLAQAGVELLRGNVTFVDAHTVAVGDRQVTAEKILIAVGGEAFKPEIPGIELALTSREMFHLQAQPEHIAVVGGGYIGVEFAGIMNGLGSKVTQIVRRDLVLNGFDDDIRAHVQAGMVQHGIDFRFHTNVEKIEPVSAGLQLTLSGESETTLTVDAVLYATGRLPNLEGLGLEKVEVAVKEKAIAVDEYSRTSQPHIFAVGDCTNRKNLTPIAIGEGLAFADTEFGNNPRHISYRNVPSAVFSYPEAATVGLTEAEARDLFPEIVVYQTQFRPMFHSLTGADEKTFMKLIVDKHTDVVLGAHIVGDHAAEIIQGVAIAVKMGAKKKDFDATIGIHPSTAEELVTMR